MGTMSYHEFFQDMVFSGAGEAMESPANQRAFLDSSTLKRPLWMGYEASRADYPMWKRGEILREVNYSDMVDNIFTQPTITTPACVATPRGELSLQLVDRDVLLMTPDRVLYHYNNQKVFAVLAQFNVLTSQQISALTGLSINAVDQSCQILHGAGVLLTAPGWKHKETTGNIWWMKLGTPEFWSYYNGMDGLAQVISLGNVEEGFSPPPGSNVATTLRHNLFSAEMMLRVMETGDHVRGAWGDFFAGEENFHTPTDAMERRKSHGDSVVVTDNGSLVIFELSTSRINSRASFKEIMGKAASWVGVIANSQLDISVIFIDARWKTNRKSLFRAVYNGVMELSKSFCPDPYTREKALHHVGIVDASWWFPDDQITSQAATRMVAFCPSIHDYRAFDQPDHQYSTPQIRRNVLINTTAALHTPPWITKDIVERDYDDQ